MCTHLISILVAATTLLERRYAHMPPIVYLHVNDTVWLLYWVYWVERGGYRVSACTSTRCCSRCRRLQLSLPVCLGIRVGLSRTLCLRIRVGLTGPSSNGLHGNLVTQDFTKNRVKSQRFYLLPTPNA